MNIIDEYKLSCINALFKFKKYDPLEYNNFVDYFLGLSKNDDEINKYLLIFDLKKKLSMFKDENSEKFVNKLLSNINVLISNYRCNFCHYKIILNVYDYGINKILFTHYYNKIENCCYLEVKVDDDVVLHNSNSMGIFNVHNNANGLKKMFNKFEKCNCPEKLFYEIFMNIFSHKWSIN